MAVSWPVTPTLSTSPAARAATGARRAVASLTDRVPAATSARIRDVTVSPVTGLVVMFLGLVLLFALPLVGLPFTAVVVLPAVIYHLRADHRPHHRTRR